MEGTKGRQQCLSSQKEPMFPSKEGGEKEVLQLGWCLDQNDPDTEQFKQALLSGMGS